ncbi:hypothetical protein [Plantactinospora sp. GCM10030261]|uniref:hypothetical protein n=1 Tax=Plantactinospora sp. GCM10030261 TaxID=3273420 RepID=UPI0036087B3D
MSDDDRFFLGLPVTGEEADDDIRYIRPRPLSELEPLFRAVLDDKGVAEFGWTQADAWDRVRAGEEYDPFDAYVSDVWFRVATDAEGHPLDEHPSIGPGDRYDRCAALAKALGSGGFDDELRAAHGDWCDVRVNRTVITVSEPVNG